MLRAYMYKLLRSPLMWLGIFGSASLMVFAMCCSSAMPAKDVEMRLGLFLDVDVYRKIIAVFADIPFFTLFTARVTSAHGLTPNCCLRGYLGFILFSVLFSFPSAALYGR